MSLIVAIKTFSPAFGSGDLPKNFDSIQSNLDVTPTISATPTSTTSPSKTATPTIASRPSATSTNAPTATNTNAPISTATSTATRNPNTATYTPTALPLVTPTITDTPEPTDLPTVTPYPGLPSATLIPTWTPGPLATSTPSVVPTAWVVPPSLWSGDSSSILKYLGGLVAIKPNHFVYPQVGPQIANMGVIRPGTSGTPSLQARATQTASAQALAQAQKSPQAQSKSSAPALGLLPFLQPTLAATQPGADNSTALDPSADNSVVNPAPANDGENASTDPASDPWYYASRLGISLIVFGGLALGAGGLSLAAIFVYLRYFRK